MQNKDIPLHDIKPLIDIQEYSAYYLAGVVGVGLIILLGLLYLLYSYVKNKNKFSIRREHLKRLNAVNRSDAKESAYQLTLYGVTFKDDSERHAKAYTMMVENLESYKYKKDVASLNEETRNHIETYIGMLDV